MTILSPIFTTSILSIFAMLLSPPFHPYYTATCYYFFFLFCFRDSRYFFPSLHDFFYEYPFFLTLVLLDIYLPLFFFHFFVSFVSLIWFSQCFPLVILFLSKSCLNFSCCISLLGSLMPLTFFLFSCFFPFLSFQIMFCV